MPVPSCHCHTISLLAVIRPVSLMWSVAKFLRINSLFIWVSASCHLCASSKSDLICSCSSSHPWISSLALGCDLLASIVLLILSSSLSEPIVLLCSPSSSSRSEPAMSSFPSDSSPFLLNFTGDGPRDEGGREAASDGVIDSTQDSATDSTLDVGPDMAGDEDVDADLVIKDGWDEWGEDTGTKKLVSLV